MTNFTAYVNGAEICRNFLQEWKHWQVPFFLTSFCLVGPMLAGTSSDTLYLPCSRHLSYFGVRSPVSPQALATSVPAVAMVGHS